MRWLKHVVEFECRNNEEALNLLLDIYDLIREYLGARNLKDAKRRLEELLGKTVKLRVVEKE